MGKKNKRKSKSTAWSGDFVEADNNSQDASTQGQRQQVSSEVANTSFEPVLLPLKRRTTDEGYVSNNEQGSPLFAKAAVAPGFSSVEEEHFDDTRSYTSSMLQSPKPLERRLRGSIDVKSILDLSEVGDTDLHPDPTPIFEKPEPIIEEPAPVAAEHTPKATPVVSRAASPTPSVVRSIAPSIAPSTKESIKDLEASSVKSSPAVSRTASPAPSAARSIAPSVRASINAYDALSERGRTSRVASPAPSIPRSVPVTAAALTKETSNASVEGTPVVSRAASPTPSIARSVRDVENTSRAPSPAPSLAKSNKATPAASRAPSPARSIAPSIAASAVGASVAAVAMNEDEKPKIEDDKGPADADIIPTTSPDATTAGDNSLEEAPPAVPDVPSALEEDASVTDKGIDKVQHEADVESVPHSSNENYEDKGIELESKAEPQAESGTIVNVPEGSAEASDVSIDATDAPTAEEPKFEPLTVSASQLPTHEAEEVAGEPNLLVDAEIKAEEAETGNVNDKPEDTDSNDAAGTEAAVVPAEPEKESDDSIEPVGQAEVIAEDTSAVPDEPAENVVGSDDTKELLPMDDATAPAEKDAAPGDISEVVVIPDEVEVTEEAPLTDATDEAVIAPEVVDDASTQPAEAEEMTIEPTVNDTAANESASAEAVSDETVADDTSPVEDVADGGKAIEETVVEGASAEEVPIKAVLAEEAPAEEAPAEEAPAEEVPTEEVPTEEVPTEEVPTEEVPTEEVPTEEVPAEEAAVEEVTEVEQPVENTTVEEAAPEATAEEVPAAAAEEGTKGLEEIPVEDAPALPAEETVEGNAAEGEAPAEAIYEEILAEATEVAEEAPPEEVAIDEAPADEVFAGGQPPEVVTGEAIDAVASEVTQPEPEAVGEQETEGTRGVEAPSEDESPQKHRKNIKAAAAAGAAAAVAAHEFKKHRDKKREGHWEREAQSALSKDGKNMLDRPKGEAVPFKSAFARQIDKARQEREKRHESEEYKEKQRRRRERRDARETQEAEERRKERELRKKEEEIRAAYDAGQAKKRDELRKEAEEQRRKEFERRQKEEEEKRLSRMANYRPSTHGSSSRRSSGGSDGGRPALLKRLITAESDTGGPLLKINMAKAGGYGSQEMPRSSPNSPPRSLKSSALHRSNTAEYDSENGTDGGDGVRRHRHRRRHHSRHGTREESIETMSRTDADGSKVVTSEKLIRRVKSNGTEYDDSPGKKLWRKVQAAMKK